MRQLRYGLLRLATACCIFWSGPALATTLAVPQNYQEMDQWCWAGTSQSVLAYYGNSYTQTEIAAYGTLGANIWNWLWGSSTGPTRNGIDLILAHFGSIATTSYGRSLSLAESGGEIDARRPFFVRWGWKPLPNSGGHFVVAKGISGSSVELMDPWYGPTINTYDWVVDSSSHSWTHSLTMNDAPPLAPTAPLAPTVLKLTARATSMKVYFSVPASDGGSPITGYTASCGGGGHVYSQPGAASPIVVPGLTRGVSYSCGVYASNDFGSSSLSPTLVKVARGSSIAPLLDIMQSN